MPIGFVISIAHIFPCMGHILVASNALILLHPPASCKATITSGETQVQSKKIAALHYTQRLLIRQEKYKS